MTFRHQVGDQSVLGKKKIWFPWNGSGGCNLLKDLWGEGCGSGLGSQRLLVVWGEDVRSCGDQGFEVGFWDQCFK